MGALLVVLLAIPVLGDLVPSEQQVTLDRPQRIEPVGPADDRFDEAGATRPQYLVAEGTIPGQARDVSWELALYRDETARLCVMYAEVDGGASGVPACLPGLSDVEFLVVNIGDATVIVAETPGGDPVDVRTIEGTSIRVTPSVVPGDGTHVVAAVLPAGQAVSEVLTTGADGQPVRGDAILAGYDGGGSRWFIVAPELHAGQRCALFVDARGPNSRLCAQSDVITATTLSAGGSGAIVAVATPPQARSVMVETRSQDGISSASGMQIAGAGTALAAGFGLYSWPEDAVLVRGFVARDAQHQDFAALSCDPPVPLADIPSCTPEEGDGSLFPFDQ